MERRASGLKAASNSSGICMRTLPVGMASETVSDGTSPSAAILMPTKFFTSRDFLTFAAKDDGLFSPRTSQEVVFFEETYVDVEVGFFPAELDGVRRYLGGSSRHETGGSRHHHFGRHYIEGGKFVPRFEKPFERGCNGNFFRYLFSRPMAISDGSGRSSRGSAERALPRFSRRTGAL